MNELILFDFRFLIPRFLSEENRFKIKSEDFGNEYSIFNFNDKLRTKTFNISNVELDRYEDSCIRRHFIKLPLVKNEQYIDIDSLTGKTNRCDIEPFDLESLSEEKCIEIFLQWIFNYVQDYVEFLQNQICKNSDPLFLLAKINSLVLNYHKTDIETLRAKKVILESINTIKEEIENLFTPLKELQSTSSPTKLEEQYIETTKNQFTWSESKTDLSELVYALAKTEIIKSIKTGKTATKKELLIYFSEQFGINITDQSLLSNGTGTFKRKDDSKTFTRKLADIVDDYLNSKV